MKRSTSLNIAATAIGAVLYALGAFITSYIKSPWGTGQFRPAIVIPSIFSLLFGPYVGGVSAAIGTFIADSLSHGQLYFKSLIAAVPSNFIAFFIFGKMMSKNVSWRKFVIASIVTLLIGNLTCAILVALYYLLFVPAIASKPAIFLVSLVIGLTLWWYSTMLPFQLFIIPPVLKVIVKALPSVVPEHIRALSLSKEFPQREFALSLIIPGLILLAIVGSTYVSEGVTYILVGGLKEALRGVVLSLIRFMFGATGVVLTALGVYSNYMYMRSK
ncbi:MAG: hypothetical protein DRJ32_02425 [Thermoprotei archaeon]|nr:MAG: hypothetical protein DRJ32_02425 [Thermoprotei archaeon]